MEFQQLPSFEGIHFGGLSMFGKSKNRSIIFFTSAPPCFLGLFGDIYIYGPEGTRGDMVRIRVT